MIENYCLYLVSSICPMLALWTNEHKLSSTHYLLFYLLCHVRPLHCLLPSLLSFFQVSLTLWPRLVWKSCSLDWSWPHGIPDSVSWVLRLQAQATIPGSVHYLKYILCLHWNHCVFTECSSTYINRLDLTNTTPLFEFPVTGSHYLILWLEFSFSLDYLLSYVASVLTT